MIIQPVSSINSIPSTVAPENQIKQIEGQISKIRSQIAKLSQKDNAMELENKNILQNQIAQLRLIIEEIKLESAKNIKDKNNSKQGIEVKV